jgi:branched-chain amino acid transport system substrate-binding protein
MRKVVLLVATTLVVALGATASSATSAASETGITAKAITIGGSFPLTGPVSLYATIPTAMKAYFSYINSRKGPDGRRGIYGRQIVFKMYDDAYNPAQTVQQARRLVEQDKVFAVVGQLGTEHNEAIRPYMNERKVPQILNATGASSWYTPANAAKYPWTRGWFPDYEFESRLYGQAIARNSPNAKIAMLIQNDSFGDDNVRGLKQGLGAKASNIVGEERYEATATDVRSQVAKLRATGATVLFIVATPRIMIQTYAVANALGWRPPVVYTTLVSATDIFLTLAQRSGGGDLPNNTYSAAYLKDPANPKWDNDAGMKLYKSVMAKYYPSGNPKDGLNLYGVAAAQAFVQLMYKAGRNPTRASLMRAFNNWTEVNPFLLPGNGVRTGGVADQRPIDCLQLQKFTNGVFQQVTGLRCRTEKA